MDNDKGSTTAPTTDELLKVLIAMAGRLAVPPDKLRDILSRSGSQKYIEAYNLCDGTRGLSDVARTAGLDKSNFNKAVSRWVEAGVVFKVGEAPNLLHIYHLPADIAQGTKPEREEDAGLDTAPASRMTQRRAQAPLRGALTAKPVGAGAGHGTTESGTGKPSFVASDLQLALGEKESEEKA